MILVSACLLGINCKYNGKNNYNDKVIEFIKNKKFIPVCPEQLGGLETPRKPSEIILKNNKKYVYNIENKDVTREFKKGALETLYIAKKFKCQLAILKANSPSCGCGKIYDGSFSSKLVNGNGITAQLLIDNKIKVVSEEDILNENLKEG